LLGPDDPKRRGPQGRASARQSPKFCPLISGRKNQGRLIVKKISFVSTRFGAP